MMQILLIDNGSKRAAATLSLRGIAARLAARLARPVDAVSLLHADQIPADRLDGVPAETLEPALDRRLAAGVRDFLLAPLFFGPSRALTDFVPEIAARLSERHGPLWLHLAPQLCPLPAGEPLLAEILADQVRRTAAAAGIAPRQVILVDHGSPIPQVTAVRHWLADRLSERLGPSAAVQQAVMERRPGADYDFNGVSLEEALSTLASSQPHTPVILAMLFISPGRHAGPGGDITDICARVAADHPGFRVYPSALVGEHPLLTEILAARVRPLLDR